MNINEEEGKNLAENLAERYNNLSRIEQITVLNKVKSLQRSYREHKVSQSYNIKL